jgi:hypothetical protein
VDRLVGLKENVIIGKLIPARYLKDEQVAELKAGERNEAMRLLASLAGPVEAALPTVGEEGAKAPEPAVIPEDIAEEPAIDKPAEDKEE